MGEAAPVEGMVGGQARKRGMRGFRDPMGDRPSPVGGRAFVVGGVRCVGSGGNQAPGAHPKRWALGRGMGECLGLGACRQLAGGPWSPAV